MISKSLQILGLQPRISKVFSRSLEQFVLKVGQNNFGNKIPLIQINQYKEKSHFQMELFCHFKSFAIKKKLLLYLCDIKVLLLETLKQSGAHLIYSGKNPIHITKCLPFELPLAMFVC